MRMPLSSVAAGLAVFLALSDAAASAADFTTLQGHVPAIVGHLPAKGVLSSDTNLTLAIGLPVRNKAELSVLLHQVYDPTSTNYHKFLTSGEFATRFGPTEQDYQAVKDFATASGLVVTGTHSNRMLLDVSGKVSDVQKAFHVTLHVYRHPTENRDFFAPDTEPSVDSSLPILHVQGLSTYVLPRPMSHKRSISGAAPGNGSGPFGGYIGSDFRNAYIPGTTLNGSGQIVGLLQFDGYFASDIATYESLAGLTNVPLQNILLDGFSGVPGQNNDEVALDIEMSISMAPALAKVVVFEAGPVGNPDDILNSMASHSEIKQLSASWGYGIDGITEQIYQEFALQGQTYLNCSGDGDAWLGPILYGSCEDPNITIVGGTTLTMSGTGASYASEKAWNWGFINDYSWNPDGYFGTSGGISTDVTIPIWQQSISMANNHGSKTMRNVPDVALTADNVFVVSSGGSEGIFGGTSCATPLWAGFMALVNQQAAAQGHNPIGFLAPAVYSLANTASYATAFHDTTTGDNTWDQSRTNFFAIPGYDLCTGLGTPNGTNFISSLLSSAVPTSNILTHISAPLPPYGTNLATLNGSNPNGTWELFVQDDSPLNVGIISNGYWLTLTTANPVGSAADVELLMSGLPSTNVLVGSNVVCLLTATNYGPSGATNIVVSDPLPVGVTLGSTTATLGTVSYAQGLIWTIGNLASGAGASLSLTLSFSANGSYLNSAQVNADTPDPNPDDASPSLTFVVGTTPPPAVSASYVKSSGAFLLSVSGSVPSIIVQASTNLTSWTDIYTSAPPFVFTSYDSTNYPARFYRALVGP